MLLSDFPREIIEKFTNLLSFEDKLSCSLVCKSWKNVFQDSLHSDIVIDRPLLNNLVNPPQDYQHLYLKTRLLARYLKIDYRTLATDKELHVLQKTFPNIKYLHFGTESITSNNFGVTADWNIWRSLTELRISFDQTYVPDIENKLVKMILCLPLLRRLQIIDRYMKQIRLSFSLDDFETIHSHLSHLGYMRLRSNLSTLSETDIERMTKIFPATKLGNLNITSEHIDHRWLCYFARKYPNLHTFKMCTSNIIYESNEQRKDTIALFQEVSLPFQHLTTLYLEYRNFVGNDYLLFWDIIHFHNIPLKHLLVYIKLLNAAYSPDNRFDISRRITQVYLPEFAKTIESFQLKCSEEYLTPIYLTEIKDSLYNLIELDISAPTFFEMDILLCAAPRLKSIKLDITRIKLKDEVYNSNIFELQLFKVTNAEITSDVLRFLSFHCRSLNELNLKSSSVYGSFTTSGCQFIDMTYTRLDKLYIGDTQFIIQDSKKCPENKHITLITRPIDDCALKQDYDPNILPVVVGGPHVKAYYEWFCSDESQTMREISTARGSRVQKFVPNYEENKRIIRKRSLDAKKEKPYVSWNKNCVFGYTKIKLGYVADFQIEYHLFIFYRPPQETFGDSEFSNLLFQK